MVKTQTLSGEWELYQIKNGKIALGSAEVPGTVLKTLLDTGRIYDPYWRCNEYGIREIMSNDFVYEREFEVENLDADAIELVCEGLDTIAEVRLNGEKIAEADDMHRTYRFSVKEKLHAGKNHISVYFASALNAIRKEHTENDIHYASTGCIHGNAVLRKAHYMFGWDWGPQLPDAGIFRDIRLEYRQGVNLDSVFVRQQHAADGTVCLDVETELRGNALMQMQKKELEPYGLQLVLTHPDGYTQCETMPYKKHVLLQVRQPQLWWPNGVGEHPLYTLEVKLLRHAEQSADEIDEVCATNEYGVSDTKRLRLGLRTITVCRDSHEYGEEFAFVVNGVKIFAMGANYIPEDNLITRVNETRSRQLIRDSEAANFNCIRVWGGGYYPDDYFYDACDEAGILIWQDLMFACDVYALNDKFEENIVAETRDNVKRLRNHACMALWCGNNEMEWGWGDMWARIQGHHPRYKADYTKIFEYILPKVVKECDDVTFWWPSSPSSGGSYDEPNAVTRGDQHYWDVWHSGKPFTEYRKNYFSFCSEYGFQSFPGMKTIESFTLPEDRNIFSQVMESHQKNGMANGKILNYVADYFLYPKDLSSLAYISQVLQLKAIQYGVEHWRRNRGRCMGSLYWQLNDCWPVASWASIDYYGRWKALHYGARRFYQPLMVSACEKEELSTEIDYYVHNDSLQPFNGRVEVALMDAELHEIWRTETEVCVAPMSVGQSICVDFAENDSALRDETARVEITQKVCAGNAEELPTVERGETYCLQHPEWDAAQGAAVSSKRRERFARVRLFDADGVQRSEQTTLFVKPKHFAYRQPVYYAEIKETNTEFVIKLQSNVFAQYVEIDFEKFDVIFSDNFFDLTDAEGKTVCVEKEKLPAQVSAEDLKKQLRIKSVVDSYSMN